MNEQEVIKYLEMAFDNSDGYDLSELYKDMCRTAIKACKKQIPKKPIDTSKNPKEWHIMSCPSCGRAFWNSGQFMRYMPKWCEKCGQHIDWTVEE